METLNYRFENGRTPLDRAAQLVGVVGSGNLEVLIESVPLAGACEIGITTAARGFGSTWQAVMEDFQQRWQLRDARISINDMGATPAVVSLRLDQAVESVNGAAGGTASGAKAS
jgi:malonate decarboxylase delta subunit